MIIKIDHDLKVTLLKSLQRGYIETDELPDSFVKDRSFEYFLMKTGTINDVPDRCNEQKDEH